MRVNQLLASSSTNIIVIAIVALMAMIFYGLGYSALSVLCLIGGMTYLYLVNLNAEEKKSRSIMLLKQENTDRRWSEAALLEEKEKLRSILDTCQDTIFFVDRRLRYVKVNRQVEKYGLTPSQMEGKALSEVIEPAQAKVYEDLYREVFRAGQPKHVEHEFRPEGENGDLGLVAFKLNLIPVKANGRITGLVGVVRDISEQKKVEQELRQARDDAQKANAAKSIFLANMSHEIRTPMGAILGFAEMMLNPGQTETDRKNYVEIILRNGRHLVNLIDDILDLAKIEVGELKLESVPIVLKDEINSVARLLRPQAEKKGVELTLKAEGLIPEVITTDPTRFRQVLVNVLGNAVKFTDTGQIDVSVRLSDSAKDLGSPKLEILVQDTGSGIDPRQHHALFKPFSQVDPSATRTHGGTGLGLFLGQHLARCLGGDLQLLESSPGKGSQFLISIDPGELGDIRLVNELEVKSARKNHLAAVPEVEWRELNGKKVLIVEDSPDIQTLVSKILTQAGAQVAVVSDGDQAMAEILPGNHDLVLMDIQLPEKDGHAVTREVRAKGYRGPIIGLTAHAMKGERERCLRSGCNDYLAKPVSSISLLSVVSKWIKKAHRAS